MFRQAHFRLTFLYSLIFLVLFWILNVGIYLWMNSYFGDEAHSGRFHVRLEGAEPTVVNVLREPTSDMVMDELRNRLIFLDLFLLLCIPPLTWYLTGRTLDPVQKALEREKQFLADISHDLRTPLAILQSEIDVSLTKARRNNEYRQTLESNREEVLHLTTLVEDMLFLSRGSQQLQHITKNTVDLTDILLEQVNRFQILAKQKKLHLEFEPSEQSMSIVGNQQMLKRLLASILDNAIKYTREGGSVTVKISTEKQAVRVSIVDTGIGIPKDQLGNIFDRFYRADTSRSQTGYGLGLSIAKQIVVFHKGSIEVASEEGKGTIVALKFPLL